MIFRDLEQKIVMVINESGLPIDAIYFIMKSLMAEVEKEYNAYCRMEDVEAAQHAAESTKENEETGSKKDEPVSAQ